MAITRETWLEHERLLATAPQARHQINEGLLKQAAVSSELLTGHPAWDIYLQRLQVLLDQAEDERTHWLAKVAGAYEDADLRMVQIQINVFHDRVRTLKLCMNLPKDIVTHAADTLDKPAQ